MVYHTLKNLPSEYDTFKQVILHERKSPTYQARLLNEELGGRNHNPDQSEALAATSRGGGMRRPYSRWPQQQGARTSIGSSRGQAGASSVYNHASRQSNTSPGGAGVGSTTVADKKERTNRGDRNPRFQKADSHSQTNSFENEMRSLLTKICDLEGRVQGDE